MDPNDSVGIIDRYFRCDFFTEFERFDRVDKCGAGGKASTARHHLFAKLPARRARPVRPANARMRSAKSRRCSIHGTSTRCSEIERETGRRVLHDSAAPLAPGDHCPQESRQRGRRRGARRRADLYDVARPLVILRAGRATIAKAGGVATNIGMHFFDMLMWVFGSVVEGTVHLNRADCAAGAVAGARARAWFLSIDATDCRPTRRRAWSNVPLHSSGRLGRGVLRRLRRVAHGEIYRLDHWPGAALVSKTPAPRFELAHTIRYAPVAKEVRAVHPFEVGADGSVRDRWRWCVYSVRKP